MKQIKALLLFSLIVMFMIVSGFMQTQTSKEYGGNDADYGVQNATEQLEQPDVIVHRSGDTLFVGVTALSPTYEKARIIAVNMAIDEALKETLLESDTLKSYGTTEYWESNVTILINN